jgi:hypothetical protein
MRRCREAAASRRRPPSACTAGGITRRLLARGAATQPVLGPPRPFEIGSLGVHNELAESYDRIDSASSSSTDPMPRRQDFSVCCKTFPRRQGEHSRRCELDNPRSARAAAGAFERTLRACMARRGSPFSLGRQANSQDFTSRKSCSRQKKKQTAKKKTASTCKAFLTQKPWSKRYGVSKQKRQECLFETDFQCKGVAV